jgi:DNA (cytosine-5)-methyltransferase 1
MKQSNDPTLSSADTPANHSATQENDKVNKTHGIYGPSVSEPYAFFDPDTHCLRMCEGTLVSGFPKLSQTLPPSGSMQNGKLYQQLRLVHHTKETGYSLWPTPTTQEVEHPNAKWNTNGRRISNNGNTHSMGLADSVQKWPTPQVDDSKNVNPGPKRRMTLAKAVQTWPTPRAAQGEARNHTIWERSLDKPQNLENKVAQVEPSAIGGKLNPTWVEWLMGFPLGWTDLEP